MSVASVNELFPGRGGEDNFTRHRTYTRTYEVYCTDPADGPATAGGSASLPRLGDSHPEDSQAVVVAVKPSQDDADPLRWIVTIDYDTQPDLPQSLQPGEDAGGGLDGDPGEEQSPADIPDNPLDRPVVWRIGFGQTTEVLRSAYKTDGAGANIGGSKPVRNSAGFLFDPPVTIEVSRPTITGTVNVANLNLSHLTAVQDAVNNATWKGFDAYCVRCTGVEASSGFENGVHFWTLTYNFAVKYDNWLLRVLDAGFTEKRTIASDTDAYAAILDSHGNPVTEPVPLNGSGLRLPVGDPEVYLLFSAYRQVNFSTVVPL